MDRHMGQSWLKKGWWICGYSILTHTSFCVRDVPGSFEFFMIAKRTWTMSLISSESLGGLWFVTVECGMITTNRKDRTCGSDRLFKFSKRSLGGSSRIESSYYGLLGAFQWNYHELPNSFTLRSRSDSRSTHDQGKGKGPPPPSKGSGKAQTTGLLSEGYPQIPWVYETWKIVAIWGPFITIWLWLTVCHGKIHHF